MDDGKDYAEIVLNVLGYREDGEWVALALEMDIRGYGDTFDRALDDLMDLVRMQISFALFKGQPEMIFKPADPIWFEQYAEARRERLQGFYGGKSRRDSQYEIRGMPIPPAHVIASMKPEFHQVNA